MSRGPGVLMAAVLQFLMTAQEMLGPGAGLRYDGLVEAVAHALWQTEAPSRSQRMSIGRAIRQLERDGFVAISSDATDRRRRWVALSEWFRLAAKIQEDINLRGSPLLRIKEIIAAMRELEQNGLIDVR